MDRCNSARGSPCDVASVDNFNKEYVFAEDSIALSMTYTRNASLGVMFVTVYESPCLDSAAFKVTLQLVYKCVPPPTLLWVPVSSRLAPSRSIVWQGQCDGEALGACDGLALRAMAGLALVWKMNRLRLR